ncbi:hypothetical protein ACX1FC_05540 [Legionella pneumophila]
MGDHIWNIGMIKLEQYAKIKYHLGWRPGCKSDRLQTGFHFFSTIATTG